MHLHIFLSAAGLVQTIRGSFQLISLVLHGLPHGSEIIFIETDHLILFVHVIFDMHKFRERERERELCTYLPVFTYVSLCIFPFTVFHSHTLPPPWPLGHARRRRRSPLLTSAAFLAVRT